MKTAIAAASILVGVYAVVALQAWSVNRRLRPAMEAAAREALRARESPGTSFPPTRPPMTREQSRTLLTIFAILFAGAYGALFGGIVLVGQAGWPRGLGIGLLVGGIALLFARPLILSRARRRII